MLIPICLILVGFVLLMLGAEYTVRGSVAIANKLKIPTLIIGLTIVAFGTSAPEFVVSIRAAMSGAEGISIGNVIGSNIANLMLILGFAAMIYPVTCVRSSFLKDYGFLLLVTLLFTGFAMMGTFVRWHGIIMLALLVIFIVYNYYNCKNDVGETEESLSPIADKNWLYVIVVTVVGLAAIIYGADLLVKGAVQMARLLGISEEIIGLTIIAFGTSLPELATTGMAAYRRQNGVALGNIIGSNIWNIVFIMGATSTLINIPVPAQFLRYDLWVMLGSTIILLPLMYRRNRLGRWEGAAFVLGYVFYIISQVLIAQGMVVFD